MYVPGLMETYTLVHDRPQKRVLRPIYTSGFLLYCIAARLLAVKFPVVGKHNIY